MKKTKTTDIVTGIVSEGDRLNKPAMTAVEFVKKIEMRILRDDENLNREFLLRLDRLSRDELNPTLLLTAYPVRGKKRLARVNSEKLPASAEKLSVRGFPAAVFGLVSLCDVLDSYGKRLEKDIKDLVADLKTNPTLFDELEEWGLDPRISNVLEEFGRGSIGVETALVRIIMAIII